MLEKLKDARKVVGTRRLVKAIELGQVVSAYVATDVDLFIADKLRALCRAQGVKLIETGTMAEMGRVCGVEVKTACAGILR
ncbi:MAG: ribosomal L7Ae/L30e/S12e/Gadd45 family protein [Clostridia bacterium]